MILSRCVDVHSTCLKLIKSIYVNLNIGMPFGSITVQFITERLPLLVLCAVFGLWSLLVTKSLIRKTTGCLRRLSYS